MTDANRSGSLEGSEDKPGTRDDENVLVHTATEEAQQSVGNGCMLVLHRDQYLLDAGGLKNIAVIGHKLDWLLEEHIIALRKMRLV